MSQYLWKPFRALAFVSLGCLSVGFLPALTTNSFAQSDSDTVVSAFDFEEARQFDFWIGGWTVNLRMIQDDGTWKDSIAAIANIRRILGGKAILELWNSDSIKGFSLRYWDPAKKRWVLYLNWPSQNRSNLSQMEGSFRHGRGEFLSAHRGQVSRFSFSDISADRLRWDDAYSSDGGETWRHQWIMEFSRTAQKVEWPLESDHVLTYSNGGRCDLPNFQRLDELAGRRFGTIEFPDEEGNRVSVDATLNGYRILDGCAVICFLNYEWKGQPRESFSMFTFNPASGEYEELHLCDAPDRPATVYRGNVVEDTLRLNCKHPSQRRWTISNSGTIELHHSEAVTEVRNRKLRFVGSFSKRKNASSDHFGAINSVCPRSGKPVSEDSLTEYRGVIVGFCNTHCRDDFAAHQDERPKDREFFDRLIDASGE